MRTGVDPRRGVPLKEHEVGALGVVGAAKDVIEADLEQCRGRRVGRDVSTDSLGSSGRTGHHGHRVPANDRLDATLELEISVEGRVLVGRDRVEVRGRRGLRSCDAVHRCAPPKVVHQSAGGAAPSSLDHLIEGSEPVTDLCSLCLCLSFVHRAASRRSDVHGTGPLAGARVPA